MKSPIFLSASVPSREPFTADFDPLAIREAVLALVVLTTRDRPLVFGGHPAISPLVEHAARSLGALEQVHIYQSRYFEDKVPEVARKFENLHWTEKERDELGSLKRMREEMFRAWDFCCAVFIGGMEGIFDEADLFSTMHRGKRQIPVGSTGGASLVLLQRMRGVFDPTIYQRLEQDRRYRRMFRDFLPE